MTQESEKCPICDERFICPSCHVRLKKENRGLLSAKTKKTSFIFDLILLIFIPIIKVIDVANANEIRHEKEINRLEAINAQLLEVLSKFMDFKDSDYVPNAMFDRADRLIKQIK